MFDELLLSVFLKIKSHNYNLYLKSDKMIFKDRLKGFAVVLFSV